MTQDNVLYAFVALKAQTALHAAGTGLDSLVEGYVGIYNVGTGLLDKTAISAGETYKIVLKKNGVLQYSPEIKYEDIINSSTAAFTADTQYTGYLGYNGASGDLEAESNTVYTPKLVVKDILTTYGNKSMMKEAVYKTANVTTVYKSDVAIGLVNSFIANMQKEPEEYAVFSAISGAAVTASNDFVNAVKVENGSKYLAGASKVTLTGTSGTANVTGIGGLTKLSTFNASLTQTATDFVTAHAAAYLLKGITLTSSSADLIFTPTLVSDYVADPVITNATGDLAGTVFTAYEYATNTSLVEGDFIRLGATTTTATALGSNVYKVIAVSGNKVTLDRAIIEATGTYASGSGYIEVIPLATAQNSATKWGIKVAGQARTNFEAGLFRNMVYDFDLLQGANFEDVLVTETHSVKGKNTNNSVAECQWFAQGNRGYGFRVDSIPVASQVTVETTGAAYNSSYIKYKGQQFTNLVGQSPASLVESKVFGVTALIAEINTALGIS